MSGYQDSNLGPPGPKPGALAGLRYTPKKLFFYTPKPILLKQMFKKNRFPKTMRREGDSNPRHGRPCGSLANCWFQPLTHLSLFLGGANVGIIFTWTK